MPEGDTIHRCAARLNQVLPGRRIWRACSDERFFDAGLLAGATFERVEARGKHLLMHVTDSRTIHSHLGMSGSWHVYQPGQTWRKAVERASIVLSLSEPDSQDDGGRADRTAVVCYHPKILELLSPAALRRHRLLRRLGPDLMLGAADPIEVVARFHAHPFSPMGEAVMNQTIVAGIGNVYKSETLFLAKVHPFTPVQAFSDAAILKVVDMARQLMWKNRAGPRRRTRHRGDRQALWVYGRNGQRCFRCGTEVRMRRQGDLGRSTYWCPGCQPERPRDADTKPTFA